jgi:A/G-specific adenine glycosylase
MDGRLKLCLRRYSMPDQFPEITQKLLAWYDREKRSLPWRGAADPYAVWVSEIMLQQTRVETVAPYFTRWMLRFPTLAALAAASQQEVLQLWEGLGYYSRGRNLHQAARLVMEQTNGCLPSTGAELRRLPGIGSYTAAAIASIAFGRDEAALDGNIRRVLARLFNLTALLRTPDFERKAISLAESLLPSGRAGDHNQAIMDLGATVCIPRAPACPRCPLTGFCQAFALGIQEERPLTIRKPAVPHHTVTAAVLRRDGAVLIARRPESGLLGGLWEFPGGKVEPGEELPACLQREIREELGMEIAVGALIGVFRHAYTHFRITLHAFECRIVSGSPQPLEASELRWALPADLHQFPMGKIDRQIAKKLAGE